jgi:DNA-binding response OmpR family regulator
MSKKIAIIESDAGFSSKLRAELEGKGFAVADTGDGKAAVDLVSARSPT